MPDTALADGPLWGAPVPPYYGMSDDRRFFSREAHYGRPALLFLAGAQALPRLVRLISEIAPMLARITADGVAALAVLDDNPLELRASGPLAHPVQTIDGGDFLRRCGVAPDQIMALLLDRAQRVVMQVAPLQRPDFASLCLERLAMLKPLPAPVAIRPHLLSPEWCRNLIDLFETSPSIDGEVARMDASGRACSVVDHSRKFRRDMMIGTHTELHDFLSERLLRLCRPEIARAFQANVTHIDRILLARYDDTGGWFKRHRDNEAPQVAFREFALSVVLNTGAYEGGELIFPEFNDERYQPPAGGGLIFSASVLHEVLPVTAGTRYVLLTFLHGEAAEARRLSYQSANP